MGDNRALHKLSPNFIIPVGTQVVLKSSKTLADGQFRKPGTVGVVVESPPHNAEPYVVQFADGSEARALFTELVLRRKEIEAELGEVADDLTPYIMASLRTTPTTTGGESICLRRAWSGRSIGCPSSLKAARTRTMKCTGSWKNTCCWR